MDSSRNTKIGFGLVFCGALLILVGFWMDNTAAQGTNILWSADHEEGNLSDWYGNSGGGEFNSGNAVSVASTDVAHTGRYSARGTITVPPVAGVRLFRWRESVPNTEAYYSAWFYFPQVFRPTWWNIFQYKSRAASTLDPDPFWSILVGNRPNGAMYLYLSWWGELWSLHGVEGPHQGEFGWHTYRQNIVDLPVGRWVHIEAFLRQSASFGGQIIVWQDGVEIVNQNNVKTRYPYRGDEWSINNYSDSILPSPATIYFDDAVISTTRIGPGPLGPRPATNVRVIR